MGNKNNSTTVLKLSRISGTENDHCIALVEWARWHPIAKCLFKIDNERKCSMFVGKQRKKSGVLKGVSDYFLPVPSSPYAGYFIEMKKPYEKITSHQEAFLCSMRNNGYRADWFDNWEIAAINIELYLTGKLKPYVNTES